ncbi:hypothetical protein HPB47_010953 [Ixodes persulcatus]|uniref:Uncharacterized protein n=1 Tax=Ixodes persulcatus TaxID=34615 RepID=A0AC60NXW8_IXOPE|nr:hypothetical protein HPB47_010953 [Ixodes persulcatus]
MDTQETPSEQECQLVGVSDQRLKDHITVIMRFTECTALGTLPPDTIGNSVLQAAGLNSAERKDTFIKIRTIQNLIAIDTYRQSAAEKILRLQEVQIHGETRSMIVYQVSGKDMIKEVINDIQVSVPDEIIQRSLEVQGAKILQARRIALSKTILITLEGKRLPRYSLYGRVVMRLYPFRPRSLFCHICAVIGHRADVCPNKPHFTTCLNCGTKLLPGSSKNLPHNCEIQCQNCGGEHPANYPNVRHEERNRKRRQQAPPKKDPETHTSGRSCNRGRSQRRRSKSATGTQWPSLPTNNMYWSLRSPERARSKSKDPKKRDDSIPPRHSSTTQRLQIAPWNGRSWRVSGQLPVPVSDVTPSQETPAPILSPVTHYNLALEAAKDAPSQVNLFKAMKAGICKTQETKTPATHGEVMTEILNRLDHFQKELQQRDEIFHQELQKRDILLQSMQQEFQKRDILLAEKFASQATGQTQLEKSYKRLESILYSLKKRPSNPDTDSVESPCKVTIPEVSPQSTPTTMQYE